MNTHANGDHCYGNQLVARRDDHRVGCRGRGDGRRPASAAPRVQGARPRRRRATSSSPTRSGRSVRRHRLGPADRHVLGFDHDRGRRSRGHPRGGRPGTHTRRRHRVDRRRRHRVHRRHPLPRLDPDHVGRPRRELDRRVPAHPRARRRASSCPGHGPLADVEGVAAVRALPRVDRARDRRRAATRA